MRRVPVVCQIAVLTSARESERKKAVSLSVLCCAAVALVSTAQSNPEQNRMSQPTPGSSARHGPPSVAADPSYRPVILFFFQSKSSSTSSIVAAAAAAAN